MLLVDRNASGPDLSMGHMPHRNTGMSCRAHACCVWLCPHDNVKAVQQQPRAGYAVLCGVNKGECAASGFLTKQAQALPQISDNACRQCASMV